MKLQKLLGRSEIYYDTVGLFQKAKNVGVPARIFCFAYQLAKNTRRRVIRFYSSQIFLRYKFSAFLKRPTVEENFKKKYGKKWAKRNEHLTSLATNATKIVAEGVRATKKNFLKTSRLH